MCIGTTCVWGRRVMGRGKSFIEPTRRRSAGWTHGERAFASKHPPAKPIGGRFCQVEGRLKAAPLGRCHTMPFLLMIVKGVPRARSTVTVARRTVGQELIVRQRRALDIGSHGANASRCGTRRCHGEPSSL